VLVGHCTRTTARGRGNASRDQQKPLASLETSMDETHSNRDATIPAIRGVLLTHVENPPQIRFVLADRGA